jgi:hypothetical protein
VELRRSLSRPTGVARALAALFADPFRELLNGLDASIDPARGHSARALGLVAVGLLLGWWIYVPVHELAHAFGCLAAGGAVTRLEIDPLYGAELLAAVFPFVRSGGEYAGRLSGFDTGGSDLVYLATDLAPFLLTLFPGIWWMRRAARRRRPLLFGAALPWAFAPFLSLTGDAYEIGSLLAFRLPGLGRRAIVGDDLFRRVAEPAFAGDPAFAAGVAVAAALGALWAFAWYRLGGSLSRRAGEPSLAPRERGASRGESPAAAGW